MKFDALYVGVLIKHALFAPIDDSPQKYITLYFSEGKLIGYFEEGRLLEPIRLMEIVSDGELQPQDDVDSDHKLRD